MGTYLTMPPQTHTYGVQRLYCAIPRIATSIQMSARGTPYVQRPAAVLDQVLKHLHPEGVLGFVLPRIFVDGRGAYAEIRERIAKRFASVEITVLPDRAFPDADSEIALLIAVDPIPHKALHVVSRKVNDNPSAWADFEASHQVSCEYAAEFSFDSAEQSLLIRNSRKSGISSTAIQRWMTLRKSTAASNGISHSPRTEGKPEIGLSLSRISGQTGSGKV